MVYTSTSQSSTEECYGRNLETGTKAEAIEECCLLVFSSWLAPFAFLNTLGTPAWGCQSHSGLAPFLSVINEMPHRLAYGQSDEDTFLIEVPSSQMTSLVSL